MKAKTWNDTEVTLNENETKVYNCIDSSDDYCGRPSTCAANIYVDGLSRKQISGYVSSLYKKRVIIEVEFPNNIMGWQTLNEI